MSKASKVVGFGILGLIVVVGGCTAAMVGGAAVVVSETAMTEPIELCELFAKGCDEPTVHEGETVQDGDSVATSRYTRAEENAIKSAESYLSFSSFSRQGLIDQLSSEYGEGFTLAQATLAVDSLDVDFMAEAVESAESYLSFSSFSCQGLIDQLSSEYGEGFTLAQARHGVGATGLC